MTLRELFGGKTEEPEPIEIQPSRIRGKIIHLNMDDGWGFISSHDLKFTRIFFHWTGIEHTINFIDLKKGMEVEFEPKLIDGKGWRAIKVKVV